VREIEGEETREGKMRGDNIEGRMQNRTLCSKTENQKRKSVARMENKYERILEEKKKFQERIITANQLNT